MITPGKATAMAVECFDGINARDLDQAVRPFTEDARFEFIGAGPPDKILHGRSAIAENFTGWWAASPSIHIDVIGVTVDSSWPARKKEVALEWDQRATDLDGTQWRRRGVTVFVATAAGIIECRDYLSELFDPQPAS